MVYFISYWYEEMIDAEKHSGFSNCTLFLKTSPANDIRGVEAKIFGEMVEYGHRGLRVVMLNYQRVEDEEL